MYSPMYHFNLRWLLYVRHWHFSSSHCHGIRVNHAPNIICTWYCDPKLGSTGILTVPAVNWRLWLTLECPRIPSLKCTPMYDRCWSDIMNSCLTLSLMILSNVALFLFGISSTWIFFVSRLMQPSDHVCRCNNRPLWYLLVKRLVSSTSTMSWVNFFLPGMIYIRPQVAVSLPWVRFYNQHKRHTDLFLDTKNPILNCVLNMYRYATWCSW